MNTKFSSPPSTPTLTGLSPLWQDYLSKAGGDDETKLKNGEIRPCWASYLEQAGRISLPWYGELQERANRQLREHGANFHLHAGKEAVVHPWQLDPIPLMLDHEEWKAIEAGLQQRARLLSLVLTDLYGPQDLIAQGLIPQDLILRHPGFQRARRGSLTGGPFALTHYTADLARGPKGQMWVMGDRAGVQSGAGYALENRTIMARLFPEEMRRLQVHRLAGSFRALRHGLNESAPEGATHTRIVFYTPGPYHPAYFEHAFLAAYLGYTMVQGDDLLVREGRVWLKALEGLQPVDVIFRRVSDSLCDPLELDATSPYGVPGLMEAVRNGRVRVVNEIGSQVLESEGLISFLPNLSRNLLGEELILPTAATWWCGQARERKHVLANLDTLVIKTIDRHAPDSRTSQGPYPPDKRDALVREIEQNPWRFIGQECIQFSTAPVLGHDQLEARAIALRAMVFYDGSGYHTMPGSLARCGEPGQTYLPSHQEGGLCKDTWVLAPEPVTFNSLWLEPNREDTGGPMSGFFTSSAAEKLYWTGRYAQRSYCLIQTLRILLQIYDQCLASGTDARVRCLQKIWEGFLIQTGKIPDPEQPAEESPPTLEDLTAYVLDAEATGGLSMALNGFVGSAFSVRENWSKDTWRIINQVQELSNSSLEDPLLNDLNDRLDNHLLLLKAFLGQVADSMTRTAGWLFLEAGRRIEHGTMMIDLLAGCLVEQADDLTEYYLLEALLEANDSLITYRRIFRTSPTLPDVLDLLLKQEKNPKSLHFQLDELQRRLDALGQEIQREPVTVLMNKVAEGRQCLEESDPRVLGQPDSEGHYPVLQSIFESLRKDILMEAGVTLSHTCFKHAKQRVLTFSRHRLLEKMKS